MKEKLILANVNNERGLINQLGLTKSLPYFYEVFSIEIKTGLQSINSNIIFIKQKRVVIQK